MPRKRLLLVDDNVDIATVFSRMLERKGYDLTTAHSVAQGLSYAQSTEYDLVICDLLFDDKSGFQFLESFRAHSNAPALAISAAPQYRQQAIEAGFVTFLPKPLYIDTLLLAIEEALVEQPT